MTHHRLTNDEAVLMTSLVPVIEVKQRGHRERKLDQTQLCHVTVHCLPSGRFNSTLVQGKIFLMENQNTQQPSLCRAGCGFYGNSSNDGMCSKCFKDALRRTQSTSPTGRISPATNSAPTIDEPSTSVISDTTKQERTTEDRKQPAVESVEQGAPATMIEEPDEEDSPLKAKRKNRCMTCRKKVGLTGFQCRCGGLFCSLHRYSDKHECSFDYKAEGQAEIRKNNPVVVRDKVQKI